MKFCHQCRGRLTLGTEKYCPECGTGLTPAAEIDGNMGANDISSTVTHITGTSGDAIGSAISGKGNIIGKEVAYTVHGGIFNLHVESISEQTLQELKNIMSQPVQLETEGFHGEQTQNFNPELTHANEAKATKEQTDHVLRDLDRIAKDKGVHIEHIRADDLLVSRTELTSRDTIFRGNEHYYKGEYTKAIQYYDKALEIDSKNVDAWYNKGVALDNLGKYKEAIQSYDKALEIDRKYVAAWYNKGNVLDNTGRHAKAIDAYNKVLEIDGKYLDAWNNKGTVLYNLRKYDEAIECYDNALEIDDKYVHAWYGKGLALNRLGKRREAIQYYDRVLELDDRYIGAWNNKGKALNHIGKHKEAIRCYAIALEIDDKYIHAWNGIGVALNDWGKHREAIQHYDRALELDDKFVLAWDNKGNALRKLKKRKEAKKCFKIAKQFA